MMMADLFPGDGGPLDSVNILVSESGSRATAATTPDFPWVRFHTGLVAYEEALIDGQYLVVNWSAMGRPSSRERIWAACGGGVAAWRPLRPWQHAFWLEVDGQRLADRWAWIGAREEARPGGRALTVELRHTLRPLAVNIYTQLDGTAFITRWLEITNTGDQPAALAAVAPWAGMLWSVGAARTAPLQTAHPFSLGRFRNTEALVEGQFDWEPLPDGGLHLANLRGRSGHGSPFFVLRNEVTGESIIAHLAYSGNWQAEFYNDHEPAMRPAPAGRLYARIGLAGAAPLRVLAPGEAVRTPAVHLGQVYGDLDAAVQAWHAHLRRSVTPAQPRPPAHPVTCNHTGYTLNAQITEEQLLAEVEVAADVGVELFVVDAGWFGDASGRWATQVGDWEETPLLPRGLQPVFDRARERGLLCGLWVEIERVGAESRLRRAHPDWLMRRRGEVIEQLDLAQPEVARHVEETIARLVEQFRLDCFRLDYNIGVGEGGESERDGFAESTMWRYYDALYGIVDRVKRRFPQLILENCSSGGGRMDLGMMGRFHWTQVTDNWAPGPTLKIINGMTLALPPEQCMTLLGAISDGAADVDFMLRIGLFGHCCVSGIFPTPQERHGAARTRWRHTIDLYKSFCRPMLATCRVFHHTPVLRHNEPGAWCVLEYAAPDANHAYAGIFRLAGAPSDTYHFRPRGLDAARRYRVAFDTAGQGYEVDGRQAVNDGFHVRVPGVLQSELLLFEGMAP